MSPSPEAGFGKIDISPRLGVELCGYGAYIHRQGERLLEPLYARAMAVRRGGGRWVIVSVDLIAVSPQFVEAIRQQVQAATGWKPHEIMVHATHSHSGPCTVPDLTGWGEPDPIYLEALPRSIAAAVVAAITDLQPAEFFHSEVPAVGFAYNREIPAPERTNQAVLEGQWITDRPEETDTTAHVFRIDRGGAVAGFISYFSCHPVVAGALSKEIHGDFVGIATNRVEAAHPGAVGLFLQGAQGDINTNFVHGGPEDTLCALELFGRRFAEVICLGLETAQPLEVNEVRSALEEAPFQWSPISESELKDLLAKHQAILDAALPSANRSEERLAMVYKKALSGLLENRPLPQTLPAQCLTLGRFSFTGLPLELMHRIKRRFQETEGPEALLLSITNGFMGYAPIRECYERPTNYAAYMVPYMMGNLPFTPEIEEEALTAALSVARRARGTPSA